LIVLLRNPIDRAYSHYWREIKKGRETLSFEEAIKIEKSRLKKEIEKILENGHYVSFNFIHYSYLTRGIYVEQLKRWFKYFPKHQFLILCSEEFYSNPEEKYKEVLNFLKLPSFKLKNTLYILKANIL